MDSYIIKTFLSFVEPYTIETFILILYFIFKDKDLKYVFLLTVITRLINATIKSFLPFSPLPDASLVGSSFPSGHLQIVSVFYVWILYKYKNLYLRMLSLFILYAGAYTQIYCCFHYFSDIIAAPILSFITVFSFFKITKYITNKTKMSVLLIMSILLTLILCKFGLPCYNKNEYLIKTLYKIIGFSSAYILIYDNKFREINYQIILAFAAISFVLMYYNAYLLNQLYWCFIFFSLPIIKQQMNNCSYEKLRQVFNTSSNRCVTFSMMLARTYFF